MARAPSHQVGPLDSREALWAALRRFRTPEGDPAEFSARRLQEESSRLDIKTVREYLKGLAAAGYLAETVTGDGPVRRVTYRLVNDVGIEAPRVRADGSEVTQGRGREQLWRTMRILGTWTVRELAAAASTDEHSVPEEEAKGYAGYLRRAGYVATLPGGGGRLRLLPSKYTGPKPPQVQRIRQVYDPNLGKVVWRSHDGEP